MLRLNRTAKITLSAIVAIVLFFIYTPLFMVVINSFNSQRVAGWPVTSFSLTWW